MLWVLSRKQFRAQQVRWADLRRISCSYHQGREGHRAPLLTLSRDVFASSSGGQFFREKPRLRTLLPFVCSPDAEDRAGQLITLAAAPLHGQILLGGQGAGLQPPIPKLPPFRRTASARDPTLVLPVQPLHLPKPGVPPPWA